MASEKEHLTLLFYPLKSGKSLCKVIELGALTGTCPKGICKSIRSIYKI